MPTINPALDMYFKDQSIDPQKKANLARDLDAGKIDESTAVMIIKDKYPQINQQLSASSDKAVSGMAQNMVQGVQTLTNPTKLVEAAGAALPQAFKGFVDYAQTTPDLTPQEKAEWEQEKAQMNQVREVDRAATQQFNKMGFTPDSSWTPEQKVQGLQDLQKQMDWRGPTVKFMEGTGRAALQGAEKVSGGLDKIKQGAEIVLSGQANVENSDIVMSGVMDMIEGIIGTAYSPISGAVEATGTQGVAQAVGDTVNNFTSGAISAIARGINPNIDTEDPEFQERVIRPVQNALKVYMAGRQFNAGKPLTETGAKVGQFARTGAKNVLEGVKKIGQEVRSKFTGLDQKTFEALKQNPKAFRAAQKLDDGQYQDQIFSEVHKQIKAKKAELSSSGKAYDSIKASKETATMPKDWMKKALKEQGIKIDKKGHLSSTSESAIRNSADLTQLEKIYKTYGGKTKLSANEMLNLRADISALKKVLGGDRASAGIFSNKLRKYVDDSAKGQLKGLEQADLKYSTLKKQYTDLEKIMFNKDGSLKAGAVSKVRNLINKGNKQQLEAIKQVYPNIETDLNILRAIENVKSAQGNAVGQYTRAGTVVGGATGNLPLLAATIVANPSVALKLVEVTGKVKGYSDAVVQQAQNALINGDKLPGAAQALVVEAMNSDNNPEIMVPFMESIGENFNE